MMKLLPALSAFALALPLGASAATFEIVNPNEPMVVVPGLEFLGASRISTVEFCAEINEIKNWGNLITDDELLSMEGCLIEMT